MSDASADFHHIIGMTAESSNGHNWLRIKTRNGCHVALHMEAHEAEAIADAWAESQIEPEPMTYDEALSMKCDAEARMDEARKLKGMV